MHKPLFFMPANGGFHVAHNGVRYFLWPAPLSSDLGPGVMWLLAGPRGQYITQMVPGPADVEGILDDDADNPRSWAIIASGAIKKGAMFRVNAMGYTVPVEVDNA